LHKAIQGVGNHLREQFAGSVRLSVAIVPYRDGDQVVEPLKWTDDSNAVQEFVNQLKVEGGGKPAEDVLGACGTALRFFRERRSNHRFMVLVCDAPGHGLMPEPYNTPDYDDVQGDLIPQYRQVFQDLAEMHVQMIHVGITELTRPMYMLMNECAQTVPDGEVLYKTLYRRELPADLASKHFIFVLDQSFSMKDGWKALSNAYTAAVKNLSNRQRPDILSTVLFDTSAGLPRGKKMAEAARFYRYYSLATTDAIPTLPKTPRGGSTDYQKALDEVYAIVNPEQYRDIPTVLIFMSDGQPNNDNSDDRVLKTLCEIRDVLTKGLTLHCVAYNWAEGEEDTLLRNMARTDGLTRSDFTEVDDNSPLTIEQLFHQVVSQEGDAAAALQEAIEESIGDVVKSKLTSDNY